MSKRREDLNRLKRPLLLLCEWHGLAQQAQQAPLCSLYEDQYQEVAKALRSHRPSVLVERRSTPLLTRGGILAGGRRLLDDAGIFERLEKMLSVVLGVLKDAQPSARAKAMKVLSLTWKGLSLKWKVLSASRASLIWQSP